MYTKQILFICFLLVLYSCKKVNNDCNLNAYPNAPDCQWFKSHNGTGEEAHGHYILSCSDGGFLQVGETGSNPKIILVKTDANGEAIWKKEISEGNHNLGNSIIETDNEYLICGELNRNSCIIKVNKNDGSTAAIKTYNNGGSDAIEHLVKTPQGYAAVGYTNAQDENNTFYTEGNGVLLIMDEFLNLTNTIDINNYMSHAYRIHVINNALYISGLTEGASDYSLIKTDFFGNVLWNKTYGGNADDHCFGMDVSADGSIFLTGHTKSGTENWDTYTIKTDTNGTINWDLKQGNPRGFDPKYIHDETWGVKATPDGGCVIVAGTGDEYGTYKRRCGNNGDNSNEWRVYLIKISASGEINWEKTYGNTGSNWAGEDVDLTADGGLIVGVDDGSLGFLKIAPF